MKRHVILVVVLLAAVLIFNMAIAMAATNDQIKLYINGQQVKSDAPPLIIKNRTMVPLRIISENLGASVDWQANNKPIYIKMEGHTISLQVGKMTATIDGTKKTLDVTPQLINNRTYVPLRFVSEALGAQVDWVAATRAVYVTKQLQLPPTNAQKVIDVSVGRTDSEEIIIITATGPVQQESFTLTNPDRLVIDIKNTVLAMTENVIAVNDENIKQIRLSQYLDNPSEVRVVADLEYPVKPQISTQGNQIIVRFKAKGAKNPDSPLTIVVDAGHGGTDPGAVGPSGVKEKNVNLEIASKLAALLRSTGFNVVMTRTNDSTVSLNERSSMANAINADLFVSIHSNSATIASAGGTETIYMIGGDAESQKLAAMVQKNLVEALGLNDRGTVARNLHVLRETYMTSILVEVAFLSNPTEEQLLTNPEFQQKVADAIYRAIKTYYETQ